MLIDPCCVSASLMDDAEDAIGADEVPGEDWIAAVIGVSDEFLGIDGVEAAIGQRCMGGAAIQLGLVDVDAFFIFGCGARWGRESVTGARCEAIAGGLGGGIIVAGIGDVVVDTGEGRAAAGDDRG